jgi:hypothetical protein
MHDIYRTKVPKQTPLGPPICTLKKMKGRRVKQVFSGRGLLVGEGGHEERVNEGESGRCILYSEMKMEE